MSKLVLTSVRDVKVGAFMFTQVTRSRGEAVRGFTEGANNPESMLCRHPEDFQLFSVGEFDDESGALVPEKNGPQFLISAADVKTKPAVQPELLNMSGKKEA